jgi:hypothetical protein
MLFSIMERKKKTNLFNCFAKVWENGLHQKLLGNEINGKIYNILLYFYGIFTI